MFLATINKTRRLLYFTFAGHVSVDELRRGQQDVVLLLAELSSGIRVVTDLGRVDSFDAQCATIIGEVMELCDQKGVDLVVRVVPNPVKDIGMNILSLFHYHHHPRAVTCANVVEAARALDI